MKKYFSILLSLVMVFSIMNVTVFATEAVEGDTTGATHVQEDGTVHEGAEHVDGEEGTSTDEGTNDNAQTDEVVEEEEQNGYSTARIVEAGEITETEMYGMYKVKMQNVKMLILDGKHKGEEFETSYYISLDYNGLFEASPLKVGDKVYAAVEENGTSEDGQTQYVGYAVQKLRDTNMLAVGIVIAILLVVVSRIGGLKTIALAIVNIGVTLAVVIGLLLNGASAILSLLALIIPIIVIDIIILNGLKRESLVAMLAVLVSTVITIGAYSVLNNMFAVNGLTEYGSYLSGVDPKVILDEETSEPKFDYLDIIVAGVVVMTLGVTIDMALRSVKKGAQGRSFGATLKEVSKKLPNKINTALTVWVGSFAAIFAVFMLYQRPILEIINVETIVIEILKLMVIFLNVILVMPIGILLSKELIKQRTIGETIDKVEE